MDANVFNNKDHLNLILFLMYKYIAKMLNISNMTIMIPDNEYGKKPEICPITDPIKGYKR